MAEYTLFCAPDTYAMSAHAILEHVGADYAPHWVELFRDAPDPAFLAASPHCRTPALLGPDGPVFETGAVALYVAEMHPDTELSIPQRDPRRGVFLQWLHYLATTLQPDVIIQFHPEFYFADVGDQARLKAASMERLKGVFTTLETALESGPYFFGDTPTVPDFILATQTIWDVIFPDQDITIYPNIARQRDAIYALPATKRMVAQHAAERERLQKEN